MKQPQEVVQLCCSKIPRPSSFKKEYVADKFDQINVEPPANVGV